ncbi:hypothetical protein [Desulfomonile tiedjei]|uniref:Uncharacterized protein n=1 Tax=Desulfomonile tiedjei (strain ATCC 49306 / DSM 6799 / DCB-1) TaxID=706587 RepID=I4BZP4_DESTA|nr:hypothetical protein [Desulfomonile tiedjei]AFM22785.1 hypothetical protein Desti_0035 [Desulfomonile tiedjei DSM 6799]
MKTLYIMLAVGIIALGTGVILSGSANADSVSALQVVPGSSLYQPVQYFGGSFGNRGFSGGIYYGAPYAPYSLYGLGAGPYSSYGDGEGYYRDGKRVCVWSGYDYNCYRAYR